MRPTVLDPFLRVVVAVSSDGFDAGIRFGAAEAIRSGDPLHVVHIADLATESPAQATQLCFLAVERARDLVGPNVSVTSEIAQGNLIDGLVELSRDARLLVLERRVVETRSDPWSTSVKVSAHAPAPVVCVPRDWNGRGLGTVTVGVDDTQDCAPLLHEALSAARARGARLRIVHVDPPSKESGCEQEIRRALAEAAEDLTDVAVAIEIITGGTALAALLTAMETSELLVIGRHHPLVPQGSRLGPVARKVVRQASCPVLLLAPSSSTASADWVFKGQLA